MIYPQMTQIFADVFYSLGSSNSLYLFYAPPSTNSRLGWHPDQAPPSPVKVEGKSESRALALSPKWERGQG
jgi:hypothetical protein